MGNYVIVDKFEDINIGDIIEITYTNSDTDKDAYGLPRYISGTIVGKIAKSDTKNMKIENDLLVVDVSMSSGHYNNTFLPGEVKILSFINPSMTLYRTIARPYDTSIFQYEDDE